MNKLVKNFFIVYLICALCSIVPFMYLGLVFGFPAYTLAAIVLTLIFRKELS